MPARLRLLKVIVQPTFVADDGDSLTEVIGQPFEVKGSEWTDAAQNAFAPEQLARLQAQYDEQAQAASV